MSNELTTLQDTNNTPLVHTSKTGKTKIAYSDLMRQYMPKDARIADSMERTAASLQNGRYVPVLRDIYTRMSDADKGRIMDKNVTIDRESPTKDAMVPFADAVIEVWNTKTVKGALVTSPAKGEKAALCALLRLFTESATKSISAPATETATA